MSAQHTPGPWVIHKHGLGSPYLGNVVREWQQDGITYMRTITIQLKYDTPEVNEANAQLIAAAPELLRTLTNLINATNVNADELDPLTVFVAIEQAKGAIAKATGDV